MAATRADQRGSFGERTRSRSKKICHPKDMGRSREFPDSKEIQFSWRLSQKYHGPSRWTEPHVKKRGLFQKVPKMRHQGQSLILPDDIHTSWYRAAATRNTVCVFEGTLLISKGTHSENRNSFGSKSPNPSGKHIQSTMSSLREPSELPSAPAAHKNPILEALMLDDGL